MKKTGGVRKGDHTASLVCCKRPTFTKIVERLKAMRSSSAAKQGVDRRPMNSPTTICAPHVLRGIADTTETDIGDVDRVLRMVPSLSEAPSYVGGSVAVLRWVRTLPTSALRVRKSRKMLQHRVELCCDDKGAEILEQGYMLGQLPGTSDFLAASWETNDLLSTDSAGDVVVFERWGGVHITPTGASLVDFNRWNTYRNEARAAVLDLLSRRASRLVRYGQVIDCGGASLARGRATLPYLKQLAAGPSHRGVPPLLKTTQFVRVSRAAAITFNLFKSAGFVSKDLEMRITLHSGANPFVSSPGFAALFERSALPVDLGGTLATGTDGRCCSGAALPQLNDADAVWDHYHELLSPRRKVELSAAAAAAAAALVSPAASPCGAFAPGKLEAARVRHRDSPKGFACFLAHDTQACAAEARLVKQHLESILDARVCLGKCRARAARV